MELSAILRAVDHTLLAPDATWPQIQTVCDDAARYHTASVCLPPSFVAQAAAHLAGRVPVCTVIGFPNGYATTKTKCFEAADAVENGADEIDMVVNLGWVKSGCEGRVLEEIRAVRAACPGKVLKVIVETCLLTEEEKISMCRVVSQSGADFIKTSTGFSAGGATLPDVALFAAHAEPHLKIKAAGGIASLADAEAFLRAGATRLGTSRVVRLAQEQEAQA